MQAQLIPATIPFPKGAAPRTPGVHLSGLIRSMAFEYGFLDKKWMDAETVEDLNLVEVTTSGEGWWSSLDEASVIRMSLGMAWEAWYLPQIPNVLHQPGELHLEGIYMTPDGQSIDAVLSQRTTIRKWMMACHEVKVTSKSINTVGDLNLFNPKNWMWLTQVACYLKAMRALRAYLHILYLYGDYSRPYKPVLHVWQLDFEQKELDQRWAQVRDYRDDRAAKGLLEVR